MSVKGDPSVRGSESRRFIRSRHVNKHKEAQNQSHFSTENDLQSHLLVGNLSLLFIFFSWIKMPKTFTIMALFNTFYYKKRLTSILSKVVIYKEILFRFE